jgi:hypothetical protein
MPNYQNSKIYKIVSPSNPDLVYYGSTTQKLSYRMTSHIIDFRNCKNNTSSFEILKYDDAIILLVEDYPCNSKAELHKKEGEYILNNNCVNKRVEGQPSRERVNMLKKKYREKNKEQIKSYYEANKAKIMEQRKKRRENKLLKFN